MECFASQWFVEEIRGVNSTTDVLEFNRVIFEELSDPKYLTAMYFVMPLFTGLSRMRIVAMLSWCTIIGYSTSLNSEMMSRTYIRSLIPSEHATTSAYVEHVVTSVRR